MAEGWMKASGRRIEQAPDSSLRFSTAPRHLSYFVQL